MVRKIGRDIRSLLGTGVGTGIGIGVVAAVPTAGSAQAAAAKGQVLSSLGTFGSMLGAAAPAVVGGGVIRLVSKSFRGKRTRRRLI